MAPAAECSVESDGPIYAELADCRDPVSNVVDTLVAALRDSAAKSLAELGVRTVGDLCAIPQTAVVLDQRTVRQVLVDYASSKSTGTVDMSSSDESRSNCLVQSTVKPREEEEEESSQSPGDTYHNGQVISKAFSS